jgi:Cu/Zn superoxide dismutase
MKKQVIVSGLALLGAVAFPFMAPAAPPVEAQQSITIQLAEQNGSGQSGTAVLTADGATTKVVLDLANSPAGPQPAHIHTGTCANLGGVVYPLEFPQNGKSTSTVNQPLSALQTGNFAINVHKSPQESSVYVACGDIPAAGGAQAAASPAPAAPAGLSPAPTAAAKPAASPATTAPASLPRTGDGSTFMSAIPAVAGALGLAGLGIGVFVRRLRH